MLVLYKSIQAILTGDSTLNVLLNSNAADPHVYQTHIQFHSEAALRNHFWVTYNKVSDVSDGSQQTNAIRIVRLAIHVWGRDVDSDPIDQIDDQIRVLLDGANISTDDLFAWYCYQDGESTRLYEVDQKVWHSTAVYECKIGDVATLPA